MNEHEGRRRARVLGHRIALLAIGLAPNRDDFEAGGFLAGLRAGENRVGRAQARRREQGEREDNGNRADGPE